MKKEQVLDHRDGLRQLGEYAKEMKRLCVLHDAASGEEQLWIFDKMTDVLNKTGVLSAKMHGRRFKPVQVRFSSKQVK